jgi:hypothetical protein
MLRGFLSIYFVMGECCLIYLIVIPIIKRKKCLFIIIAVIIKIYYNIIVRKFKLV